MSKIPDEKLKNYQKVFENASNFYDAPSVIRDFWMRMAKEKVPHLYSQNLSR